MRWYKAGRETDEVRWLRPLSAEDGAIKMATSSGCDCNVWAVGKPVRTFSRNCCLLFLCWLLSLQLRRIQGLNVLFGGILLPLLLSLVKPPTTSRKELLVRDNNPCIAPPSLSDPGQDVSTGLLYVDPLRYRVRCITQAGTYLWSRPKGRNACLIDSSPTTS